MIELLTYLSGFNPYIALIFAILLAMSCASWAAASLILIKIVHWRIRANISKTLWQESALDLDNLSIDQQSAKRLKRRHGPFFDIALTAISAYQAHRQSPQPAINLSDYLASQLTMKSKQILHRPGLTLLANIASSAPFIGLLGTVWGIYLALNVIGEQQNASLPELAPAIAEALVITGAGLVVAVPALLFYNLYARQYDRLQMRLDYFAQGWHNYVITRIPPQDF